MIVGYEATEKSYAEHATRAHSEAGFKFWNPNNLLGKSQRFIDPTVNLYGERESFKNKTWVLPLNDEIKELRHTVEVLEEAHRKHPS